MPALNRTIFNLRNLVEKVYNHFTLAAAQKGLRFTYSVSHKIPQHLQGDEISIEKAFEVLVGIAIDEAKGGAVELNVDLTSATESQLTVKFEVNATSKRDPYWFSVHTERIDRKLTSKPKNQRTA